MATGISWTDETWNPVIGCSRVSPGCQHCYAEVQAARIVRMGKGKPTPYDGLVRVTAGGEERWTGEVRLMPERLAQPLRWRTPKRVFVNSMSDLFHEKLTNEQIAAVFGVMAAAPQHTFQVLTKRARRMREWFEWAGRLNLDTLQLFAIEIIANDDASQNVRVPRGRTWPLPNVWLGVSVENQEAADERIPELLRTPAAVRFLSCEPLLGPVNVCAVPDNKTRMCESSAKYTPLGDLDWIIAGCESGPGARPCSVEWLRSLRDQCEDAGVPFFLKQAIDVAEPNGRGGYHSPISFGPGTRAKGRAGRASVLELPYLDGIQHAAFPEVSHDPL